MNEPDADLPADLSASTDDAAWSTVIARLEQILAEERRAIAALDTHRLPALGAEKTALATRLRTALQALLSRTSLAAERAGTDPEREDRRRSLRVAAMRILAGAEANRLLLVDAVEALAEARGMTRPTGTYNARARLESYTSGRVVKTL